MYKFLFFLFFSVSAFFFFSWVIDSRYFEVYSDNIVEENNVLGSKKILALWSDKILDDSTLSKKLIKELDIALSLYNDGFYEKLILSGDKDHENGNIVLEMMDYLVQAGMPIEDLIADFYSPSLYEATARYKDLYELSDFYYLDDRENLLKFSYISDRLGLGGTIISYVDYNESWFEKVFSEWKMVFQTKIFSPDVYLDDKNPNYFLDI